MREQYILDLAGRNVLAAAHDHVVGATVEKQIAVGIEITAVLGREPAVGIELTAEREILAGDLGSAHEDKARLFGAEPLAIVVADLEFDRRRLANGCQAPMHERVAAGRGRDRKRTRMNASP